MRMCSFKDVIDRGLGVWRTTRPSASDFLRQVEQHCSLTSSIHIRRPGQRTSFACSLSWRSSTRDDAYQVHVLTHCKLKSGFFKSVTFAVVEIAEQSCSQLVNGLSRSTATTWDTVDGQGGHGRSPEQRSNINGHALPTCCSNRPRLSYRSETANHPVLRNGTSSFSSLHAGDFGAKFPAIARVKAPKHVFRRQQTRFRLLQVSESRLWFRLPHIC